MAKPDLNVEARRRTSCNRAFLRRKMLQQNALRAHAESCRGKSCGLRPPGKIGKTRAETISTLPPAACKVCKVDTF